MNATITLLVLLKWNKDRCGFFLLLVRHVAIKHSLNVGIFFMNERASCPTTATVYVDGNIMWSVTSHTYINCSTVETISARCFTISLKYHISHSSQFNFALAFCLLRTHTFNIKLCVFHTLLMTSRLRLLLLLFLSKIYFSHSSFFNSRCGFCYSNWNQLCHVNGTQ